MTVFYPFGIPTTSSFAETSSFAIFTVDEIATASFATVARTGPVGLQGINAVPADCERFGADFKEFPTASLGYTIPEEILQARETYILCVERPAAPPFVVPLIIDGGVPETIYTIEISGGTPATQFFLFADGGTPITEIPD